MNHHPHRRFFVALLVAVTALLALVAPTPSAGASNNSGTVVVANRASGTLSLIDVATDQATTLALPAADNPSEPMYVVYSRGRVFVGDRGNDRVVVYNPWTWSVVGEVPTGDGVFHMWADPNGRQLWVNNDVDNTITVISPRTLRVLGTIDLPADLVAEGGKPHDVILNRTSAYVTMIGIEGDSDAVIRYSTRTFTERARAEVGNDPHVTISPRGGRLWVASQDSNELVALNRSSLAEIETLIIPATHGLDLSRNGRVVYTTNISGGGSDGLWAVDARRREVLGVVDTPFGVPHNIVLTANNRKLYVTHSGGTADQVSVYTVGRRQPVPELLTTVTVELNPFGLEFVPA